MSSSEVFYCKNASDIFLQKESVDLFVGHPPYYMAELELNGGDSNKQMQNALNVEEYWNRLTQSVLHMEHALKDSGHIFLALQNTAVGLGVLDLIAKKSSLILQSIRIWDYSKGMTREGNNTVLYIHYTKKPWGPGNNPQGPFVLTNSWLEATEELKDYHTEYSTVGAAPEGVYTEIVTNFSKEGDTVCDLFAGCGTVGVVAKKLNRKFIYNDVSTDKLAVAKKRLKDISI